MTEPLQRYQLNGRYGGVIEETQHPTGDWVKATDALAREQALQEENKRLREALVSVREKSFDATRMLTELAALSGAEVPVEQIIRRVAELSDRTSPDDWPEAMLVTAEELRDILNEELQDGCARSQGTVSQPPSLSPEVELERVRALIATWREQAEQDFETQVEAKRDYVTAGSRYGSGEARSECADELEALFTPAEDA
jgi:hypothetical protein